MIWNLVIRCKSIRRLVRLQQNDTVAYKERITSSINAHTTTLLAQVTDAWKISPRPLDTALE
jgi:hypothetical protein